MFNQNDSDSYCGYCKCDPCQCDGFGGSHTPTCGYCHSAYDDEGNCDCDGFGGDPVTHEKSCRWCSGLAIGNFCTECGRAQ